MTKPKNQESLTDTLCSVQENCTPGSVRGLPGNREFLPRYSPELGRWTSSDPVDEHGFILLTTGEYIDSNGGLNLYGFLNNNPLQFFDLNGLAIETPWDAFNVASGVISLGCNIASGNAIGALVDGIGLVYDATATAIPGLPGGAQTTIQLYRAGKLAPKMYNYLENNQTAYNVYRYGVRANNIDHAHHIVARTAKGAKEARKKLDKLGIDVNSAENGVALPSGFHQSLHTKAYYDRINAASRGWNTKQDAIDDLNDIAWELLEQSGKVQ